MQNDKKKDSEFSWPDAFAFSVAMICIAFVIVKVFG